MHVYYSAAYTLAGHAFDTTRKAGWIAESLRVDPIPGLTLVAPQSASEEQIRLAHSEEYVLAVRTGEPRELAESSELGWDAGLWPMVRASTGGAIAAALAARSQGIAGSLSSGLHHARRDRGAGYCTFNGLAIAAREALAAGARTVLILDLDAHCGGGTHELVKNDQRIWHADVAVDAYDRYDLPASADIAGMPAIGDVADSAAADASGPSTAAGQAPVAGAARTERGSSDPGTRSGRGRLTLVGQAADYLPAIARMLADLEAHPPMHATIPAESSAIATASLFDLCLYNAGMDPFEGCAVGGMAGISRQILAEREQMVFEWCRRLRIPVAFVLAGGYVGDNLDQAGLVDLHRLTLAAAVR
jgi:acetoin utilization deacetylase AcuC-like enzyme